MIVLGNQFLKRKYLGLALAVCWPMLAAAQFGEQPHGVDLTVKVFIDSYSKDAPTGLSVQLLDNFGTLETEQTTDGSGRVEFQTTTGNHGIRIYGRGVEEYTETFEIEHQETRKTENVVVRSKRESPSDSNVTSSTVPASRLQVPRKAHDEFEKGSRSLGQKDWSDAKKRFEAAIAIFPDYDLAYNGLGDAALASGDLTGARAAFEKAISLNKDFAEAYRNLALVFMGERNYEQADTLLTQSLVIDPLNARALTYAANAELLTHKYREAIAHARKAHSLPHDGLAGVHIVAARALEATQQPQEAVKEYRLYLVEDPKGRDTVLARDSIARLSGPTAKP